MLSQPTTLCQWCSWAHMQLSKRQEAGRRMDLKPVFLGYLVSHCCLRFTAPHACSSQLLQKRISLMPLSTPSHLFLSDSFNFINKIPQYNPSGMRHWGVLPLSKLYQRDQAGPFNPTMLFRVRVPWQMLTLSASCWYFHTWHIHPAVLQGFLFAGLDTTFPVRGSPFVYEAHMHLLCGLHRHS